MNNTSGMYLLRQIIRHDAKVDLPKCMYEMKKIHRTNDTISMDDGRRQAENISDKKMDGSDEMRKVYEKQCKVLDQLHVLEQQLEEIKRNLRRGGAKNVAQLSSQQKLKLQLQDDLVINANPENPPYSLILLAKLIYNVNIQMHMHSSVVSLPENTQKFVNELKQYEERPQNGFTIRLIWKNVDHHFELVVGNAKVIGECNFLRYLARIANILSYDESNYDLDTLLDLSFNIVRASSKTERIKLLRLVSAQLAKHKYLFGDGWNLADLALYSAIKQTMSANDVNVGLTKWMVNCEAI